MVPEDKFSLEEAHLIVMSPPARDRDILLFPLRLSVRPSVCLSVRPSVCLSVCPSQNRVRSIT